MTCVVGYRVREVTLKRIAETKNNVRISRLNKAPNPLRPVKSISYGSDIKAKLPIPDTSDAFSMICGLFKRSAVKTPIPDGPTMDRLANFTKLFCIRFLKPIDRNDMLTVQDWLNQSPYTLARREELLEKFLSIRDRRDPKYFKVKAFVKDESYPEYKYPRGIYSRTDEFKTLVGPYFSMIDKKIFALPWFIKKIPHVLRPHIIASTLEVANAEYCESDYVSYEAHFTQLMFRSCEWIVYEYLTQNLPGADEFMWYVKTVIGGMNYIQFREFRLFIDATRMSGEMNTSSGNGLYNLIATMFLYYEKYGEDAFDLKIFVEGDDGIHRIIGSGLEESDYNRVGLTVEFVKSHNLMSLSFCGIVMDKFDLINVTDPISYLVDFFWLNSKYYAARDSKKKELLRCKAFSALFQYPGCPIIYPMAKKILQLTADVNLDPQIKHFSDLYKYEIFMINYHYYQRNPEMYDKQIPYNTRLLVRDLYNLDIPDQIDIENIFNNALNLPINFPNSFYNYVPFTYQHYYSKYSIKMHINNAEQNPYTKIEINDLVEMQFLNQDYLSRTQPMSEFNKRLNKWNQQFVGHL